MELFKEIYSTLAPLFYLLVGAWVTYLAQLRIARHNERKETKRELTKLFGEFSYWSKEYAIAFYQYGKDDFEQVLLGKRVALLKAQIKNLEGVNNREWNDKLAEDELAWDAAIERRKQTVIEYRKARANAFRYFSEISLINPNPKLDSLHNQYTNIGFSYIPSDRTLEQLESKDNYDQTINFLTRQMALLSQLTNEVFDEVKRTMAKS